MHNRRWYIKSENERRNPEWWFWRSHSLPDVLNRWTQGLPPERVHLVTVPQSGHEGETLWERYCRAFAIDPSWAPDDSPRRNPSLGIDETILLRRLNRRLRKAGLEVKLTKYFFGCATGVSGRKPG